MAEWKPAGQLSLSPATGPWPFPFALLQTTGSGGSPAYSKG